MFELEILRQYEEDGLVKSSTDEQGHTVWCYTQKCVVDRAWDDVTRACRGLVLADNGYLVSRPLPKFHNWNEPEAVIEDGPFLAFDKMDGTLIVVGNDYGEAVVSTKGSFSTWHSEAAREMLMGFVPPKGQTAVFEFIHPENRVVVDYNGYEGLVFLTGIDNMTGADLGRPEDVGLGMGWHGDIVIERRFNLKSMLNTIQNPDNGPNREGFVVAWVKDGEPWNRVKLKFSLYVQLHGIYTGLTNRRVWECLRDDTLDELLELAPDELHDDINEVAASIRQEAIDKVYEADQVAKDAEALESRKDQAEVILSRLPRELTGIAFKILDGKRKEAGVLALSQAYPVESKFVGNAGLS